MRASTGGLTKASLDAAYEPQNPNLVCATDDTRIASGAAAVTTLSAAYGARVVIPKAGTLTDLAIYVGTSSGNVDVGVFDTAPTTRTKLYSTGSMACPAGGAWTVVGNPALAVNQGDQLDLVLACDNTTATFLRLTAVAGAAQLPANFWPSPVGGLPFVYWIKSSAFPLPATIAENTLGGTSFIPMVIARVV